MINSSMRRMPVEVGRSALNILITRVVMNSIIFLGHTHTCPHLEVNGSNPVPYMFIAA